MIDPQRMPRTLPRLFAESVEKFPDRILLWEKKGPQYQGITFAQMRDQVHRFAGGLISLDIRKGDRIALMSEGRADWVLSAPALARNFRKNIEKAIQEKGARIASLFRKALQLAYDYNGEGWNRGRGMKKLKKPLYLLYDRLIFKKIRRNFGGRIENFYRFRLDYLFTTEGKNIINPQNLTIVSRWE